MTGSSGGRAAPRVSVILPCLNEEANLERVLKAVLAQDIPREDYEVVVVDGGSIDRSVEIAESAGVRVVSSPRGVSVQRNRGAAATTAPVLAFVDSDCVVPTDWLRRGLYLIEKEGADLAGGPTVAPEGAGWIARAWDAHMHTREHGVLAGGRELFRLITTSNLFIRRSVFDEVGGFDESLGSGEDFFLCSRVAEIRRTVQFDDGMIVRHFGAPRTVGAFFREQVWHSNRDVWRRLAERTGRPVGQAAYRYGVLTAALLALVVAGAVAFLLSGSVWPLAGAIVAYACVPMLLAARTCARARSARQFVPLAAMYWVYGFARAAYLLGVMRLGYRRRLAGAPGGQQSGGE